MILMKKCSLALLLVIVLCSCHRQNLEERLIDRATVSVTIDWSLAMLDPDNDPDENLYSASVWLFSEDGDAIEYKLSDATGEDVSVPVGEYKVLVFNKTITDYSSGVAFRGTGSFDTFEYYIVDTTKTVDILAVWRDEEFIITTDMITQEVQLFAQPERLVHQLYVQLYVNNLNSASSATGTLTGVSSSVLLCDGTQSTSYINQSVSLNNRTYDDGSSFDGTIEGLINHLGQPADSDNSTFETLFTLSSEYDGSTTYPTPPDDPFIEELDSDIFQTELIQWLYIGFDNDKISLPVTTSTGGFDLNVNGWGEIITIPL